MESSIDKNKRIARNTLQLYFRMLFVMFVSLFTSRIILQALGIVDYGLYNVVGGIVVMCSVVTAALSSAISRFLTYELGKGDIPKLKETFSASVTLLLIMCTIIILLAETLGLWFLYTQMNYPPERANAVFWIYQFSVFTFCLGLVTVPYNALITAHEKMSVFAFIGIIECLLRFCIALIILHSGYDRLILYGFLLLLLSLLNRIIYTIYCRTHFEECRLTLRFEKKLLKEVSSLASWNFIGATASLLRSTGGNILINIFCGPAVNAARGVGLQVNSAISGFSGNFLTALSPQIIKSYAQKDFEYMQSLIFRGIRFPFYILYALMLPVFFNIDFVLNLWLVEVPQYTAIFVRLVMLLTLVESLNHTLVTSILATGKVKDYQLVVGGTLMLNFPLSLLLLWLEFPPYIIYIIAIVISTICNVERYFFANKLIHLNLKKFVEDVILKIAYVGLLSAILPLFLAWFFYDEKSFFYFFSSCTLCIICTLVTVYYIGLTSSEKLLINNKMKQIKERFL